MGIFLNRHANDVDQVAQAVFVLCPIRSDEDDLIDHYIVLTPALRHD
jgi:hypothetical protein